MKLTQIFVLCICMLSTSLLEAQITAYINKEPLKAGATIDKNDLATLQVGFQNPHVPSVIYGKAGITVRIKDAKGETHNATFFTKKGSSSVEHLIKGTTAATRFNIYNNDQMQSAGDDLKTLFEMAAGVEKMKTLTVEIEFFYREKLGYDDYSEMMFLLDPVSFNVTAWDATNVALPYADISLDKTDIKAEQTLRQDGPISQASANVRYLLTDKESNKNYAIYKLDKKFYGGITPEKVAMDFINGAGMAANEGSSAKKKFDKGPYKLEWKKYAQIHSNNYITKLHKKTNKKLFKMDLMTALFSAVTINTMKGYKITETTNLGGNFVMYILSHPTDKGSVLVVNSDLNASNDDLKIKDAYIQKILNAIKTN